jgi:excisionase family DNA binding protein
MLLSIEQVAEQLGMHVRTIRNWIHEGRLPATRVGRRYRIESGDLDALLGRTARAPVPRERRVRVTSIVDIDAVPPDLAQRLTTLLLGATRGRSDDAAPLDLTVRDEPERGSVRVTISGSTGTVAQILGLIDLQLAQETP